MLATSSLLRTVTRTDLARSVFSRTDLLRELEPVVRLGLDRHLSAATEWFPHEYVPYEVGRNYLHEPWEETDSVLARSRARRSR